MRPIERIPIFLNYLFEESNVTILISEIYELGLEDNLYKVVSNIYDSKAHIKECWLNNPDWRFSQVLANYGYLPNIPGFWYYIEEDEILEKLGIEPREYLFWGRNYDKDMNLLPKTERILIKDMATDHIQTILDGKWCTKGKYFECFNNELKLRENVNSHN